ncbi:MAG: hypothetical protein HY329_19275 [Chloroflexi bacterium]|nr:hypothetical protein [Chloroflexota bacterium]
MRELGELTLRALLVSVLLAAWLMPSLDHHAADLAPWHTHLEGVVDHHHVPVGHHDASHEDHHHAVSSHEPKLVDLPALTAGTADETPRLVALLDGLADGSNLIGVAAHVSPAARLPAPTDLAILPPTDGQFASGLPPQIDSPPPRARDR